ncbi:hypothetical protein [Candidatus Nitrosocosmicus sp. T]
MLLLVVIFKPSVPVPANYIPEPCRSFSENIAKMKSEVEALDRERTELLSSGNPKGGEKGVAAIAGKITKLERDIKAEEGKLQQCLSNNNNTSTTPTTSPPSEPPLTALPVRQHLGSSLSLYSLENNTIDIDSTNTINITGQLSDTNNIFVGIPNKQITFNGTALVNETRVATTTFENGSFISEIPVPNQIGQNWTIQAHFKDSSIRPVDDLSPIYNDSDSNIVSFSTVSSSSSSSSSSSQSDNSVVRELPTNQEEEEGDSNNNGDSEQIDSQALCNEENTILDESTGQCVPMEPLISSTDDCEDPGTLMDETTGICAPPEPSVSSTDTCEEQQPGTILDESTGQCVPMSEPDVPIINGTTNDCEDPGTLMDETTGICAPPEPSITSSTDTCEEQQPGTILDESTGQCVPMSEPDVPIINGTTNDCEDPGTLMDETTGICAPPEPSITSSTDTCEEQQPGTILDESTGQCVPTSELEPLTVPSTDDLNSSSTDNNSSSDVGPPVLEEGEQGEGPREQGLEPSFSAEPLMENVEPLSQSQTLSPSSLSENTSTVEDNQINYDNELFGNESISFDSNSIQDPLASSEDSNNSIEGDMSCDSSSQSIESCNLSSTQEGIAEEEPSVLTIPNDTSSTSMDIPNELASDNSAVTDYESESLECPIGTTLSDWGLCE